MCITAASARLRHHRHTKKNESLPMPSHLLRTIRDEHHSLAAMLDALHMVIKRGPGPAPERFFDIVRTMPVYVKEFSENVHYPKETQMVFPRVMQAALDTADAVRGLEQAHRLSVAELGALQVLLAAWHAGGPTQGVAFERAAHRFCDGYRAQIRMVEVAILPVAEQLVTDAQWDALARRYMSARKPGQSAAAVESGYLAMYNRIALWLARFLAPARLVHK